MFSTDTSPTSSPKFPRRRVASLGANSRDILSYMQVKTSGKRKDQERSPENKADSIVRKKFIVKIVTGRETAPEEEEQKEQEHSEEEQQKDMKDMEELRKLISSMHEDMKNMEGKMMEIKERERGDTQKEIEERLEHLEGCLPEEGGTAPTGVQQAQVNPEWRELKRRLEENERRARRNNLIIIGKKMEQTRLKESVEQWLGEQLQVICKVNRAWKIRNPKEEMIGIECENSEKWKEIMTNKSKLKGTDIFIEKDLTWQERER
ncbi:hypothetical protein QAD02_023897 [Eretmocerus hayati]|uniref:Uncharacterized protein n=1 Tax=Eretmocerus hayati TaxID=131215 RepID=A0ACC2PXA9_9HYME|nr:hypothetical protein QAD02_023897 [Eretmocerus hayati]